MIRRLLLALVLLVAVSATLASALADDFAPPPWLRAHPNAVTAEWEFLTPANPLAARRPGPANECCHQRQRHRSRRHFRDDRWPRGLGWG